MKIIKCLGARFSCHVHSSQNEIYFLMEKRPLIIENIADQ